MGINGKLGLNKSPDDSRTLLLKAYVPLKALKDAPASVTYSKPVKKWGMLLNDRIGCCAIAAPAHCELAWTSNDKDAPGVYCPSDPEVLLAYQNVSGYRPSRPSTDVGCNMLDVMKYWRNKGIGKSRIEAFAKINHRTSSGKDLFKYALWKFGGLLLGLNMPIAWDKVPENGVWKAPSNNAQIRGSYEPGSWGGHAVHTVDYSPDFLTVSTWGRLQKMSWKALDVYCFECWVPLGPSWWGPDKLSPAGFDVAQLRRDLATLS